LQLSKIKINVKYWRKPVKSKTGTVDVLLKNEKIYWMEMVEYLKLLCDGDLVFGGEGEVCERKCYTYSQRMACAGDKVSWADQTLPIARCANSACTMHDGAT
jgi:hypothetical protein